MKKFINSFTKQGLSIILALAIMLCSLTVGFTVAAENTETVSFTLDAVTNGGTVDGGDTKAVELTAGTEYTCDLTVTAPTGQQFIGWSTDSGDYVGELTFTPENNTTYYAIFGEVIYVGGTATDTSAILGSIDNPYTAFGSGTISSNPFTSTAVNCVVVLNGSVTLSSISGWSRSVDKLLYITGLDPTTGVQNTTSVNVSTFATGVSGQSNAIFKLGLYIDNITVTAGGNFYVRGNASNLHLGNNVDGGGYMYVTGADNNLTSVYIESGAGNIKSIVPVNQSSVTVQNDLTVVMNGGKLIDINNGIKLGGKITRNVNVIINGYDSASLRVNTANIQSVGGAVNYIFNNNTKAKIEAVKLLLNCTNYNTVDTAVPTTGGFYYIDSAEGGKVMPTETAGKFKVEFDEGNNYITVNGTKTELDSDNCFEIAASSTNITPTDNDWVKVAYGYEEPEEPAPEGAVSFTLDAATNGGTVDGENTKVVQLNADETFTNNVTVTAPTGQQFIGWSTDKDDYVGKLTFTPEKGKTYYAIFGEVIYVGGTATDTTAAKGSKANPYASFKYDATLCPTNPFSTTAKNCIAVLNGTVTLGSISNWYNTRCANGRLLLTGLDPTTGVQNETAVTLQQFALGLSGATVGIFDKGVYVDDCTIVNVSANPAFYLRQAAKNFKIGTDVEYTGTAQLHIDGVDVDVPSLYIESGISKAYFIRTTYNTARTIAGDATIVVNGGYLERYEGGIALSGTINGNANVVINGYTDDKALRINTLNLQNVGGAVNYIFNNGTKAKIAAKYLLLNCDNDSKVNATVPTTGGFYYIDSAVGGKVMPTETAGKFKVEFDKGYNYIQVNGERVALDSNNCFTLTAAAATTVTPADSDWAKITYHYEAAASEDNIINVPVNHKLDLSKIGVLFEGDTNPVNGAEVTWDSCKLPEAEIVNGTFIAFSEGETLVTASKDGKATGVTFKVTADAEVKEGMVRFTQDGLTVERVGAGTYTVTVTETNEKALKYGTLTNNAQPIIKAVDNTGVTFTFTTAFPEKMSITAEYITKAERDASIYFLGAQIRPETNEYTAGLRFINRFPQITGDGATATMADGYTQAGIIVIPEILWDGVTIPTADELLIPAGDEDGITEISLGRYNAQNVLVRNLMSSTAVYSDATAAVVGIPADMQNVKIVAIPYIIDENKNITFVDDAQMNNVSKSYGEIYAAEFPISAATNYADANIKDVFAVIGTNHELDNDPNSNAITYELGEEITYKVVTAGNYGFEYELYKDNNGAIAEYGEAAVAGVETCVKKGTYNPATDGPIFTLTTRLDNPGTARLAIKVKDANGEYLNFKGDKNLSVTAAAGVNQIALPTYMVATENEMDAFYSTISTNYASQVARMKAGLESDEFTNWFMGTKTKGEVKTYNDGVSDVFEVTYVGPTATGNYQQYSIVLATVASIDGFDGSPLTSADVGTGKFPYNDYLSRPSTFLISVPSSAAADSCEIVSGYYGYGTYSCHFQHQANTIFVQTTAHGVLNLQNDAYYIKASEIDYTVGGTKNGTMIHSEESPYDLYGYGVLVRDYMSLQFAKYMPQFNENADITTKGGSQGGWQALGVAAADTDVNICNTAITWLTIAKVENDGLYDGWMPTYSDAYKYIMSPNAVVSIGNRAGFRLDIEAALSDQTCPLYGLLAMYNMSKTETTFAGYQFSSHSYTKLFADAYGEAFTVYMNK
ncbi:MAG: hypothetical protein E7526_01255 [Ruminococcaceae bacterium]|nr:hypothetical protein [Oscillospiraceae bacterium]